jgi:hypothetical protein
MCLLHGKVLRFDYYLCHYSSVIKADDCEYADPDEFGGINAANRELKGILSCVRLPGKTMATLHDVRIDQQKSKLTQEFAEENKLIIKM